jgi:hypothetical protein
MRATALPGRQCPAAVCASERAVRGLEEERLLLKGGWSWLRWVDDGRSLGSVSHRQGRVPDATGRLKRRLVGGVELWSTRKKLQKTERKQNRTS